jgi:phosphatidylcholine synthase
MPFRLPAGIAIVAVHIVPTFVPIQCVHPFRVAGLRTVTLLVTAAWGVAAIGAVANPFPSPLWVKVLLIVTAASLTGVGALRSLRGRRAV